LAVGYGVESWWNTTPMTDDVSATPSRRLRGASVLADPLVRELLDARLVVVLATIEPDGAVHAVALWCVVLDDAVVLATGASSRKVRNLERDPRATLVVHDSRPGFEVCGASIRGRVEIVRGDAARPLIERVHRRYVSEEGLALPAAREFLAGDDVALVLRPESAVTWDERANPAGTALSAIGGALPLEPTSPRG
jgi:PPOX class probable F420-dependent enzyme